MGSFTWFVLGLIGLVVAVWPLRVKDHPLTFFSLLVMAGLFSMAFVSSFVEGEKSGYGILAVDFSGSIPIKTGAVYETLAVYPPQNNIKGYVCVIRSASGDTRYYYSGRPLPRFFTKTADGQYVPVPQSTEQGGLGVKSDF